MTQIATNDCGGGDRTEYGVTEDSTRREGTCRQLLEYCTALVLRTALVLGSVAAEKEKQSVEDCDVQKIEG
jgi:hypothetical protein